jgi:hypothetical protein
MTAEERVELLERSLIHAALREAAKGEGMAESVTEDLLMYGSNFEVRADGRTVAHKDGSSPKDWLKTVRPTRPHWFSGAAESQGATTLTNNPWTTEHWNKTNQGRIYAEDPKAAEKMAAAAGVNVFAAHPKKTA